MEIMSYDSKQSIKNLIDNINRIFDMSIPESWGEGREANQSGIPPWTSTRKMMR
jgi:hypothetical protein